MELLVSIPNYKASKEKYPPSCPVLFVNGSSITPYVVESVAIDLSSRIRQSLFVLQGKTKPVASKYLLYAPQCSVWFKNDKGINVKGIVGFAFHPPNRVEEAVYRIQETESGAYKDVSTDNISFRDSTTEEVPSKCADQSAEQRTEPSLHPAIETDCLPPEISSSSGAIPTPESDFQVTEDKDKGTKRSLDGCASICLTLPEWISRDHIEDVVDSDTIKEVKYTAGCSSISIIQINSGGGNLGIRVESNDAMSNTNAIEKLKGILLESVEDHEQDRLRHELETLNSAPQKKQKLSPGNLGIHVESKEAISSTNAVEKLKGILLESGEDHETEDHEQARLLRELKTLTRKQKEAAKRKQKSQRAMTLLNPAHNTETPPASPTRDGRNDSQQEHSPANYSRLIQVPAWAGDLTKIQEDIQQASPWMELNLHCSIQIVESSLSVLIVRVESSTNLDSVEEAAENLILRNVDHLHRGRLLYDFSMHMSDAGVNADEVTPLPQRSPDNANELVYGAVVHLPDDCTRNELCGNDLIRQVLENSGCNMRVVGCEDSTDRGAGFVYIYGQEAQICKGCTMALEKIAKLGFVAPKMGAVRPHQDGNNQPPQDKSTSNHPKNAWELRKNS